MLLTLEPLLCRFGQRIAAQISEKAHLYILTAAAATHRYFFALCRIEPSPELRPMPRGSPERAGTMPPSQPAEQQTAPTPASPSSRHAPPPEGTPAPAAASAIVFPPTQFSQDSDAAPTTPATAANTDGERRHFRTRTHAPFKRNQWY